MTPEHIVNQVGDKSALTVSKDNITAMVGGNGGMSPEMLKGLMGPIAAMIANTVGNKVSTQQVSSMASATVAAMAGQVMAGQETSASTWDDSELDDATAALITSQVGDLLNSTMLEDLIDAVNTEIHMILGDSFTVENESATQVADELVPIITSVVQDTLSSDEINHLAQNLGTTVITEAALAASNNALMNDTDSPPTIVPTMPMTTENMAIMSANIGAALNRAAGLPAPASGAGAGGGGGGGGGGGAGGLAGMMGGLQSGLMDKIKGLSGGSVMQLLPKQLNELTQNKFNMKSQQGNILQTAMQNITHKAKSKLALVGSPVTANTG